MRLTVEQQQAIRTAVAPHFGSEATVPLFGSRVYDDLHGGELRATFDKASSYYRRRQR